MFSNSPKSQTCTLYSFTSVCVTAENLCFLRRDKTFDEVDIVLEKSVERNVCLRVNIIVTGKYAIK